MLGPCCNSADIMSDPEEVRHAQYPEERVKIADHTRYLQKVLTHSSYIKLSKYKMYSPKYWKIATRHWHQLHAYKHGCTSAIEGYISSAYYSQGKPAKKPLQSATRANLCR